MPKMAEFAHPGCARPRYGLRSSIDPEVQAFDEGQWDLAGTARQIRQNHKCEERPRQRRAVPGRRAAKKTLSQTAIRLAIGRPIGPAEIPCIQTGSFEPSDLGALAAYEPVQPRGHTVPNRRCTPVQRFPPHRARRESSAFPASRAPSCTRLCCPCEVTQKRSPGSAPKTGERKNRGHSHQISCERAPLASKLPRGGPDLGPAPRAESKSVLLQLVKEPRTRRKRSGVGLTACSQDTRRIGEHDLLPAERFSASATHCYALLRPPRVCIRLGSREISRGRFGRPNFQMLEMTR